MFKNILTQKLFLRFLDLLQNICFLKIRNKKYKILFFLLGHHFILEHGMYQVLCIRSNEKPLPWVVHQVVYVCSYHNMI